MKPVKLMKFAAAMVIGLVFAANINTARALELVMFEQDNCEWCETWNKEIGPTYPKTTEGKKAPLRKVDIFDPRPKDLKGVRRPRFTPTFVLIDKGKEVGRIRGYPGEDFFWGLLDELIEKHEKQKAKQATTPAKNKPAS